MSKPKQPTYTEKQAADLAAIDEQITEARARLDAAETARTAADAAQNPQGIVNASAAAEAAQRDLERLEGLRRAAAWMPEPEPDDAYVPAVEAMERDWKDRVASIENQIAAADERLAVIDAALERATVAADVAEAARLTAERDALDAQNGAAYDMLAKAKAMPMYDAAKLRALWDAEDARIGREWRRAVEAMKLAANAYKRAWAVAQGIRGSAAWTVAERFKEYLKQSDTPTADFAFDAGMCWGSGADMEATDLWLYRKGAFILGPGVDLCRGTRGR